MDAASCVTKSEDEPSLAEPIAATPISAGLSPGATRNLGVEPINVDRRLGLWSLLAALFVHTLLAIALEWAAPVRVAGAGGVDIEASSVEVTIITAAAMESLLNETESAAPMTVLLEAQSGPPTRAAPMPSAFENKRRELLDTAEVISAVSIASSLASQMPHGNPREPPFRPEPTASQSTSMARGIGITPQIAAAAIASPGEVYAYARSIAEALGRTRPRGNAAGRGTVRIVFAVAENGTPEDVQVKATSGRESLDVLAVTAVRQTRFPVPPTGMTLVQRTFEVPYHFR